VYGSFNKYAQGGSLEDNLEMKYSMTKNLYEQPQANNYQFESAGQAQGNNVFEQSQF
jgi:hypothetical protein